MTFDSFLLHFDYWSDAKEVDLNVDRFMKDMESIMKCQENEDSASELDIEESSSSDMDFGKLYEWLKVLIRVQDHIVHSRYN